MTAPRAPGTTLRLTFVFVGDLMTHPDLSRMADDAEIYRVVTEVFKDGDPAFANLQFSAD